MSTYAKTVEISAESPNGFHEAVEDGVKRAHQTLDNVSNVWVKNEEVIVSNGEIKGYRAHLKVTFQTD